MVTKNIGEFLFLVVLVLKMPAIRRTNLGRRTRNAASQRYIRTSQIDEEREERNEVERNRWNRSQQHRNVAFNPYRAAFNYNVTIDYSSQQIVDIGSMNIACPHCKPFKFKNEAPGICCASGQIKLTPLIPPPEPLHSLVSGNGRDSIHFLNTIQQYNNCFQMTSFGATKVVRDNFMPTFKIQGQIYHEQVPYCQCQIVNINFCKFILWAIHQDKSTSVVPITIRADKTPVGQHTRRFNAPTIDEVAIVVVGDSSENRDIVYIGGMINCSVCLKHIDHMMRCNILFYFGKGKMGAETNKKVSSMNYYSYRLMVRENEENHILKCRRLFHQYAVDMYVKVETERLTFIRLNQAKLRSEEYIHLRDAINADGNAQNVGRTTILPATYVGSPRHMHEYAQDAMSYVRHYGSPDLFITFTCNPQWIEIRQELFPGQSPIDRHDITARVFKRKLKSLMDFIVKHRIFGDTRCWMYSVEWQKRGLPHAHILIWLVEKIRPNEIDDVISAEIPDNLEDPLLHEVVTKNMIHGPCGILNPNSPCMVGGKCSKRFPRQLVAETITGNDGYPLYRRRSTEDNGRSTMVKVNRLDIEVDNRWVVPFSPLLCKTFKAHINVEFCHSVKSIKYICKYVNKGSDMAVFGVAAENSSDEITQFQMGRYVSSNEAMWRIFSFAIHERHPTVIHLAVHLENGQRVYFTAENVLQRVDRPPSTTLTSFFEMCQNDDFARTLLYSEMPRYYTWNQSSKKFQRRN
ncbi:unnamed protein product, partial [Callosobruchus maculatus]